MGRGQGGQADGPSQALLFGRRRSGSGPLPPVRVHLSADDLWDLYHPALTNIMNGLLELERNRADPAFSGKTAAEQASDRATGQLNYLATLTGLSGFFTVRAEGPHSRNRQLRDVQVTWHGPSGSLLTAITPGFGPRDLAEELVSLHQA